MANREISIGQLASRAGCNVRTIRYYEQIGLLPEALRTEGNQRRYAAQHVARSAFVRHSRELGFSLEAIRELLSLADAPDHSCAGVDAIAKRQLEAVERRMRQLGALRNELARMLSLCAGGKVGQCHVIEVLGDSSHAHCLSKQHGDGDFRDPL